LRGRICPACPTEGCLAKVKPRGFPSRRPKVRGGFWFPRVRIRQWGCAVHGAFREYPPFLVRFKHYVAEVIDAALEARSVGETVETFCETWELPDVRTPTRWIAGFVQRLKSIGLKAERRLEALNTVKAKESPPATVPMNRWQYAYVWTLLGQLQAACKTISQPLSRSHFVFTL
jgi:hypothetical protein